MTNPNNQTKVKRLHPASASVSFFFFAQLSANNPFNHFNLIRALKGIGTDTKMTGLNDDKTIHSLHFLRTGNNLFGEDPVTLYFTLSRTIIPLVKMIPFSFFKLNIQSLLQTLLCQLLCSIGIEVGNFIWGEREVYNDLPYRNILAALSNRIRQFAFDVFTSCSPIH